MLFLSRSLCGLWMRIEAIDQIQKVKEIFRFLYAIIVAGKREDNNENVLY
jgi:hypothetical protein